MDSNLEDFLMEIDNKDSDVDYELMKEEEWSAEEEESKQEPDNNEQAEAVEQELDQDQQAVPEAAATSRDSEPEDTETSDKWETVNAGNTWESSFLEAVFSIVGTKSWNTQDPYIIPINQNKLLGDVKKLGQSFYFLEIASKQSTIQKRLSETMLRQVRNKSYSIASEYADFINKLIIQEIEKVADSFAQDSIDPSLLKFHLGPATLYKIIKKHFNEEKYGLCYISPDERKINNFLPWEYIKDRILNWYEENINRLDLPFDSLYEMNNIKNAVSKRYQEAVTQFNTRHALINKKVGPTRAISKDELLKMKGNQWFGSGNIVVYKRFIGKTVFG
ncbi:MAG: hypothetical protein GY754_16070 [bacterium]|nr:hypothetical protein [bacterium]